MSLHAVAFQAYNCMLTGNQALNPNSSSGLDPKLQFFLFLLSQVPGAPIIFATINGIHLETPSEMTKKAAKEVH